MSKTIDNILANYKIDSHTDLIILEYNKMFNTITTAFLTNKGIEGKKQTSIHIHHNELLDSHRPYVIRLMHRYYLDEFEWKW